MALPQRLLYLLMFSSVYLFVHTAAVHPQAIIPRESVITTIAGTGGDNGADTVAPAERQFRTTASYVYDAWGERAQPWARKREFRISHGYRNTSTGIDAGILLDGNERLENAGSFLNWNAPSYGNATLQYREDPEYSVGVAMPIDAGVSLLLGAFHWEPVELSLPAFNTPFTITGTPATTGAYGGLRWDIHRVYSQATMGTAEGSLDGTVVPSAIGLSGTLRLNPVYTGSVGYDGRRVAFSAAGVYGLTEGNAQATWNDKVIGALQSDSAGTFQAWSVGGSVDDTFRFSFFTQNVKTDGWKGYLDLRNVSPVLNGLFSDSFRYEISDAWVDLSETGATGSVGVGARDWYFRLGGGLSYYTAEVGFDAFYRRLGIFLEEAGATLVDDDGFLLTTSAHVTLPLVPSVTLALDYIGVVPVSFDYIQKNDPATIVREGADAASKWQGYRLGIALRVAATVFE